MRGMKDSSAFRDFTDEEGRFSLWFDRYSPTSGDVDFDVIFGSTRYAFAVPSKDLAEPVTLDLDQVPLDASVEVRPQPLGSPESVATFDLIIRNHARFPAEVRDAQFTLKVDEDACGGIAGVNEVQDLFIVNLDAEATRSGKDRLVTEKNYSWFPSGSAGCLHVKTPMILELPSDGSFRARVDVRSQSARERLTKAARRPESELPPDLRYFLVSVSLEFSSPNLKRPVGTVWGAAASAPGEFPSDVR